jgi:hypothetical protein
VRFCICTGHKHTYDSCMNNSVFILITTNMLKVGNFEVTSKKFSVVDICTEVGHYSYCFVVLFSPTVAFKWKYVT